MPTAQQTREIIAERRAQDFEAFQRHEAEQATKLERPYVGVEALVDYEEIEVRAAELIENHEVKPKPRMPREYLDNARTAIFEALTASGHISRVEITGETLEDIYEQVITRWLNSYDMSLPDHELKRRFREICEELVIYEVQTQILAGELPPDTEVASESAYVVGMSDEAARRLGYRPQNKKGMTRSTGLRVNADGTLTRVIEQVSYSNSSAHDNILRLHQEGINVKRSDEADVDLLGAQTVYSRSDLEEGVIGVQRRIDAFRGADIRFGETPTDITPTYESIREVSKEREERAEFFIGQLAELEEELDRKLDAGEIGRAEWSELYGQKLRDIVRTICIQQPRYTKDALGMAVVQDYYAANERERYGDSAGAAAIADNASGREQSLTACGFEAAASSTPQSQQPSAQRVEQLLRQSKEYWRWVKGRCIVVRCPTRNKPDLVSVGPCDVCAMCQAYYDNGKDPHQVYKEHAKQQIEEGISKKKSEKTQSRPSKTELAKAKFGQFAEVRSVPVVGGADDVVYDPRNEQELGRL